VSTRVDPPEPDHPDRDQPAGELLRALSEQVSELVRLEIKLARTELAEKAKKAALGVGLFGAAAVLGLALLGAVTTAAIAAVAIVLPLWAAALVVAGLYLMVIAALALAGRGALRKATPVTPEQTVDTVKEDVAWAKTRAKSVKK
jgi:uncharacterized membrane protein YqjE